jgi:hypothetical protein
MTTICLLNISNLPLTVSPLRHGFKEFWGDRQPSSIDSGNRVCNWIRPNWPAQQALMEAADSILLILLMPGGSGRRRPRRDRGRSLNSGLAWLAADCQVDFRLEFRLRPRPIILITLRLFFNGPSNSFPLSSTLGKRSFACCCCARQRLLATASSFFGSPVADVGSRPRGNDCGPRQGQNLASWW